MHSKKFTKSERKGLPGGPNEMFTYVTGVFSTEGYKNGSPDIDNPFNIIPSGKISMKDVDFPVIGIDNLGNKQMMTPGGEYEFPGDMVFELPMAQLGWFNDVKRGARKLKRSLSDYVEGNQGYVPDIFTAGIPTKRALNTMTSYANPKNYNAFLNPLKSYDNYDTFDKAFKAARDDAGGPGGFFLYDGKRHSTKLKGEAGNKETADIFSQLEGEPYYERLKKLWIEQGQPNISMGTDESNLYLPISQAPLYNFAEGVLPETGVDLFAEGNRAHLNPFTKGNDIYISKPTVPASGNKSKRNKQLAENILEELTHNYQINQMGTAKFLGKLADDAIIGGLTGRSTYNTPGALEHEAHGSIEDAFKDYVFDNKDFPRYQEGGEEQPWYKKLGKRVLNEALYKMNPLYTADDVLQASSIPANVVREAIEGIGGKGDGSFDWKNIIPDIRNTTILDDTEDQKPVSQVLGQEGTKGFVTDLLTDPTSYLGAGIVRGIAKKTIPKVIKSTGNIIKTQGDDFVTDMLGNTIKKSDAERLFRIEDANVNANTFIDPKTKYRPYESGNWMGSDENDILYYLNHTAKAGVPRGAGNMLDPGANRRLITGYLDKKTADLFRATNPNATDVVKDFSGGYLKPKSTEFLIPPDLMDVLRNKGKTLDRQGIFEVLGDFYKKHGGDLPKAQRGFFKEIIKQGAKKLDDFIPLVQRNLRSLEKKLGVTSKNMVDQVDVPGTDVKIESPSNLAKFLDKVGFNKLTGRNSYLPSWAREGTGDKVVARTKMPGAYSFDNKGLRLLYDPTGGYYHIPEAFIDNPMVAGKTFKALEDFIPKGSILKQAPEGTLSSDSYKLMLNRLKRGKFSDVTNYNTSMFLNPYGKKTFGVEGKNAFSALDDSTFDAINSLENQMFNLQRQGRVGEGFTGFGKRFKGDTYEVGVPNLAIRKNYTEGGTVSWQWKGKSYSGKKIGEDENNIYARTHNGKVKTISKKQYGGSEDTPPNQSVLRKLGSRIDKALDVNKSYLDFPKTDSQIEFEKKMNDLIAYYDELDPTGEDPQYQAVLNEKIQEIANSPLGVQNQKDLDIVLDNEDALRHAYSTADATKKIQQKVRSSKLGKMLDALGIDDAIGFLASNALGIGHEIMRFTEDDRPFQLKLKESGQDIYNNIIGSIEALKEEDLDKVFSKLRQMGIDGKFFPGQVSDIEYETEQKRFGGKIKIYQDYINGVYEDSPNIKHVEKVYDKLNRVYKKRANQMNMTPPNFIMTHLVKG